MYRLIIVDDENVIRRGIMNLINWDSLDCQIVGDFENGSKALSFMADNAVDMVITDIRMPVMDGLELIQAISRDFPEVRSIILTAFSEFELAQRALRYGAVDFIIKNDFVLELPKAIEKAKEQRQTTHAATTPALPTEEQFKLKSYLLENLALGGDGISQQELDRFVLDEQQYCLCSCELLLEQQDRNRTSLVQMLRNFLSIAGPALESHLIIVKDNNMTVAFCRDIKQPFTIDQVLSVCGEIVRLVEELMRMTIKCGVSRIMVGSNSLPLAYRQSVIALSKIATSHNQLVLFLDDEREDGQPVVPIQLAEALESSLFDKDIVGARQLTEQLCEAFAQSGIDFERIKIHVINLCLRIFRKLGEHYAIEQLATLEDETYLNINRSTTIYSLFLVVDRLVDNVYAHIIDENHEKHYLITRMDDYIKQNYARNISLQNIAEQLCISSSYASRLYRNKTGGTVTDAINRRRVERAKQYLQETTLKVYEIAEKVGVEDSAYFTTVFTKYAGCGPTEYRNGQLQGQKNKK